MYGFILNEQFGGFISKGTIPLENKKKLKSNLKREHKKAYVLNSALYKTVNSTVHCYCRRQTLDTQIQSPFDLSEGAELAMPFNKGSKRYLRASWFYLPFLPAPG